MHNSQPAASHGDTMQANDGKVKEMIESLHTGITSFIVDNSDLEQISQQQLKTQVTFIP